MDNIKITINDFRKNSGIVGLIYFLEKANFKSKEEYGYLEDKSGIWIDKEKFLNINFSDVYVKSFVDKFEENENVNSYFVLMKKIKYLIEQLDRNEYKLSTNDKDVIKYINDKLFSNSYKSGFNTIKNKLENTSIYDELEKNKLKPSVDIDELKQKLKELEKFLIQEDCKEIFSMKSLIYLYINRFWDNKSFLLPVNAKKDIKETFKKDFELPLISFLNNDNSKSKDLCIDCGCKISSKEKIPITFMSHTADDLSRKKSAFWNGNVDAFLCPLCAFVYSLSPLGFNVYNDKFLFLNTSDNIEQLLYSNSDVLELNKKDDEKKSSWMSRVLRLLLEEKSKEINNLPVIIMGNNGYKFQVISRDILKSFKNENIKYNLKKLEKSPFIKIKSEYINIYEETVMNILNYRNQYANLNNLLKFSLENNGLLYHSKYIFNIQININRIKGGNDMEANKKTYFMSKNGYDLRIKIMNIKNSQSEDVLRGVIYQLLNSLSIKNDKKFIDIILRLYSSVGEKIPSDFINMIQNKDLFLEYGYAFLIGLKGGYYDNKQKGDDENE